MTVDKYPVFVGRQQQIDQLIKAAKSADRRSRVLLLDGQGGIGKTALLQQIESRLREEQVLCTRLFDMDDTSYHLSSYFCRIVAEDLGAEAFANYLNALNFYETEERRHIDLKTMFVHLQKCGYAFTEDFNRLAKQKRLTILIDTFEEVQDTDFWGFFKQLFLELDNTTFIIAGRRVKELSPRINDLQQKLEDAEVKIEVVPLAGLTEKEINEFFAATAAKLESDQKRMLALLTNGNPLLLCLALDCYRYGDWLEALDQKTPMEIEKLVAENSDEAKLLRYEFEKSLVLAYADTQPFSYFIRRLAHASRRVDKAIYKTLIPFHSDQEAEDWWVELQKLPYIRKRASSDYISVHDVLRELIAMYVMPRRDPDREERRQINKKLIECYKEILQKAEGTLKEYDKEFDEEAGQQDKLSERPQPIAVGKLAELLTQRNALEGTIWILQAEALHYQLIVDLAKGSESFIQQFDAATVKRQLTLRQRLTHEIKPLLADGSIRAGTKEYLDSSRRLAGLEAEAGQAEEAVRRVEELINLYKEPIQQVELLELRGGCKLSLEENGTELAISDYELALNRAIELKLPAFDCARLEKQLGWCYRQIGNWKNAGYWYGKALERLAPISTLESPVAKELASLYTNNAYIEALQGNFPRAIDLGRRALQHRQKIKLKREQGMSHSTLGEIYRYNRHFAEALKSYRQAEDIFYELNDTEWLGRLWQQEAICLLQMGGDINRALEKIKQAIDYCTRYYQRGLPSAYNRAGRIVAAFENIPTEERVNQSLYYFRVGVERALETGDMWFFFANCVEAMEMLNAEYELDSRPKFLNYIKSFDARITHRIGKRPSETQQQSLIYFPDLLGRREVVLGTLDYRDGFPGNAEKLDSALHHYVEGFQIITKAFFGSYGLLHIAKELDNLAMRVTKLEPKIAQRWRNKFTKEWQGEEVHPTLQNFPERLAEQLNMEKLSPEREAVHQAA